ncbi:MAG TPA: hypothetical protein PLW88_01065 [Syntrophorhabdaceae bacterium]|nr:hypothetical protein [Syntrophorhabdaceae bacterium]HPP05929.1 hypothetical protein [Syntrophorhabdaceae bacterium]
MEIILTALKNSAVLTGQLLLIILPLTISYEFLKHRGRGLEGKKWKILGISSGGLVPLITGVIIGLTYGAGVIIHSIRSSNMDKKEAFLIMLFLSICHAIVEDTLIFVVIGANGIILVVVRFFLAFIFTYFAYRWLFFKKSRRF